jgi:hypothetical protein
MLRPIIGCQHFHADISRPEDCLPFQITLTPEWIWSAWLEPATTREECQNKKDGRYGCLFPGNFKHLSWHNDTYCRCSGGFSAYAWDWEDGVWSGGSARPLQWIKPSVQLQYEYDTDALSFSLLEDWLVFGIEESFLYPTKSQTLCESNYINIPLTAVVCDCLAEDSPKGLSEFL